MINSMTSLQNPLMNPEPGHSICNTGHPASVLTDPHDVAGPVPVVEQDPVSVLQSLLVDMSRVSYPPLTRAPTSHCRVSPEDEPVVLSHA